MLTSGISHFWLDIHVPLRMNCNVFGDPLNFHLEDIPISANLLMRWYRKLKGSILKQLLHETVGTLQRQHDVMEHCFSIMISLDTYRYICILRIIHLNYNKYYTVQLLFLLFIYTAK